MLADAGHVVDEHQQGILKLHQVHSFQAVVIMPQADLLKPWTSGTNMRGWGRLVDEERRRRLIRKGVWQWNDDFPNRTIKYLMIITMSLCCQSACCARR